MNRAASKPHWYAEQFSDHAILAIGELSDFRPYNVVSERSIIDRVIHLAGVLGSDSELHGIVLQALRQPKLIGRINVDGSSDDGWALTIAGTEHAKNLVYDGLPSVVNETPTRRRQRTRMKVVDLTDDPNVNLTAKWIEKQGQPLIDQLRVWLGGKMRRSQVLGQVEDHVQQFLLNMIKRDSLREALLTGDKISFAKVKGYAHNQGRTDTRDASRNPVCRAIHGALTPKEVKEYRVRKPLTVRSTQPSKAHENPNFTWAANSDGLNEGATVPMEAVEDETTVSMVEQKLAFDAGFAAVEDILRRRAPQNAEQYKQVLYNRIVLEMTVREISEHMKITRNQAASLLRTAKNIIQREREAGRGRLDEAFDR